MIQKHPDHDLGNDDRRVDASVDITVDQGVTDHREEMTAARSPDGLLDAGDDLGAHGPATLPEPPSASRDAVIDDGAGIMEKSIRKRSSKAGKALGNHAVSNDAEEASSVPLPAPLFTNMLKTPGNRPKDGCPRASATTICYTMTIHNRQKIPGISGKMGGVTVTQRCYTNCHEAWLFGLVNSTSAAGFPRMLRSPLVGRRFGDRFRPTAA